MLPKMKTPEEKLASWGPGPWVSEPDHVEWRHEGMPCIAHRHPRGGHWCGYVGVEAGHPWDARMHPRADRWSDDPADTVPDPGYRAAEQDADVHGGITYGAGCDKELGICHEPLPGEEDNVYWLGFDCAHAGDYSPQQYELAKITGDPIFLDRHDDIYKDLTYVTRETNMLAEQAIARRAALSGAMTESAWNEAHPVGTSVRYWPIWPPHEGLPPVDTRTRSEAWTLGDGSVVVMIEGKTGGVHLSHIEVNASL